jgi:hypothetical protein
MQSQKLTVYSVLNRFGKSKKSGKDYNFYQALIESKQKSFSNCEALGIKLDDVFIPVDEFEKLKKHDVFPVECEAKFEANFSTGRLSISQLTPLTK